MSSQTLVLLERFIPFMVLLYESEAGNLAMEMLSLVSARLEFSKKVERYPVLGLKPCERIMVLCVLGSLFASESTISD